MASRPLLSPANNTIGRPALKGSFGKASTGSLLFGGLLLGIRCEAVQNIKHKILAEPTLKTIKCNIDNIFVVR